MTLFGDLILQTHLQDLLKNIVQLVLLIEYIPCFLKYFIKMSWRLERHNGFQKNFKNSDPEDHMGKTPRKLTNYLNYSSEMNRYVVKVANGSTIPSTGIRLVIHLYTTKSV
ncbi:hypothetical protein CEXT_550231 [Caerostris extrusa]|uniref:Uncharacterized protein n=1 Tax=Caerostris extrusa TaxID=172846 RepID=A0AAV4MJD5_CAEEX|nr:hypothetical protein CEXT_550231 [Caerostris extrusa]